MSRTPRLKSKKLKSTKFRSSKKLGTPQPKSRRRQPQRSYDDTDLERIIDGAFSLDAIEKSNKKKDKNVKKTKKGKNRRKTVIGRAATTRSKSRDPGPKTITHSHSNQARDKIPTFIDLNSGSSNKSNKSIKSPIGQDMDDKMLWRQQTEKSELQLTSANQQIMDLNEEKQSLLQQVNALKQEISTLKASNDMERVTKEITENEIENKVQIQIQQYQTEINEKQTELNIVNDKHEHEMESLQSTIENLKFEQMKLNKQLQHKDKLYQHKLQILESDIAGKDAINQQLKTMKGNVEKQLKAQTDLTHQLMDELEDTRKRSFNRSRVPRNNSSINLRVTGGSAGGCCSSWWGKPQLVVQNTDSKYKNMQYTTQYNEDEGDHDSHIM